METADLAGLNATDFGCNSAIAMTLRVRTKGFRVDVYSFTPRHDVTRDSAMGKGGDVRLKKSASRQNLGLRFTTGWGGRAWPGLCRGRL